MCVIWLNIKIRLITAQELSPLSSQVTGGPSKPFLNLLIFSVPGKAERKGTIPRPYGAFAPVPSRVPWAARRLSAVSSSGCVTAYPRLGACRTPAFVADGLQATSPGLRCCRATFRLQALAAGCFLLSHHPTSALSCPLCSFPFL